MLSRLAVWTCVGLISACASKTDRVILLPGADGRPSGAVTVRAGQAETVLAESYAQATVAGGRIEAGKTTAEQVQADFGPLLAVQPVRARSWTVYFHAGSNQLAPESQAALTELRTALAGLDAGEVIVTGHTDRVGAVADNDRLSAVRAATVRDLLTAAGVPADRIAVQGRGERAPLVPTADEVAEPRNRRVEIKLR
jgi:OmpA-OmpF porin, OOP family